MKNLIVGSALLLLVSCGAKTPYETFREENNEEVALSFGASSFVVNTLIRDKDFKEIRNQISGIKKYKVLISKSNPVFIQSNFQNYLKQNNFQEIFHSTNNGENLRIYSLEKGTVLKEVLVEINNESQLVVVKVQGDLMINNMDKLTAFNEVN
jgi:hypothetical protein